MNDAEEEDEFRRALKKRGSPLKALIQWAPMAIGGVAGALTFLALDLYWPFASIPIVIWVGLPLVVGGGVIFGLQRVFGLEHPTPCSTPSLRRHCRRGADASPAGPGGQRSAASLSSLVHCHHHSQRQPPQTLLITAKEIYALRPPSDAHQTRNTAIAQPAQ